MTVGILGALKVRNKNLSEGEYKSIIRTFLDARAPEAMAQLDKIRSKLPDHALEVRIGIHPGQGEEGFFDIMVHLEGPNLYVLNKAIQEHRSLFEVRCIDGKMQPDVPIFDGSVDAGFSVNDAIVDTCMEWIEYLWRGLGGMRIPAVMFGEDDYGSTPYRQL
ncbi:DUF6389 family protein [Rhizobium oryzicola]|uniref:DUF6389 family protein n=1 Tax=Rhizobium oryzicola TaxID=1232668 RepID=A0ABT8ST71_9HYPH|nr:DUF6389 family protein [Rhizobium oryzicola]MDO1581521.1 DUF6389 family protein [Rhizobium oryzicola]